MRKRDWTTTVIVTTRVGSLNEGYFLLVQCVIDGGAVFLCTGLVISHNDQHGDGNCITLVNNNVQIVV